MPPQTTSSSVTPAQFSATKNIDELYKLLALVKVGPGWNKPEPSLWPLPKKNFLPAHFSYATCRAALEAAGKFVSTELAERRNLILANPVAGNNYATARTIVAAYQMVKGHETARSHRHTPNALRVIVEGGAKVYTVVNGKKIPMLPGDVLLTPNWSWHGHANESSESAYWIDFLDAPLVHLLEPMFLEGLSAGFVEETDIVDEQSPFRFAFNDCKARLAAAPERQPGLRDILLGPQKLDTLDLHMLRLDAGCKFADRKSTANSVYAVIDGAGTAVIDASEFNWSRGDVFVVPAWNAHAYRAERETYLLRVTDEPVMKRFNWLRVEGEER